MYGKITASVKTDSKFSENVAVFKNLGTTLKHQNCTYEKLRAY